MINSLSFGLSDQIADASGVSADSISESIENWASDVGKRAGNYILNDPALYDAYNVNAPMQVEADLCAEVLCGSHASFSFPLIATQV